MKTLRIIFSSTIFNFISTRYFGYAIIFVNSLLFAKYLGLFYLGIYGFLTLFLQYLSYANFGVQYSLNFFLSTSGELDYRKELLSNSLIASSIFCALILLFFVLIYFLEIPLFPKFHLNNYYLIIGGIAVLQFFNQLFINVYRTYGILTQINIHQVLIPLLQFLGIFFFKEEKLLTYIIGALLFGNFITIIIFYSYSPIKLTWIPRWLTFQMIVKKGIDLLIYNISFYLIMLSGRTLVSIFYPVEAMGLYSFGSNLSNAVMMIMGSISFLFFSKIINRITKLEDQLKEIIELIEKVRNLYVLLSFLIGFTFFIIIPYLTFLAPQYHEAFIVFKYLLLSQMILSNVFGYSTLLIAKHKERKLTYNALSAIGINLVLAGSIIYWEKSYLLIGLTTLFSVLFYNIKSVSDGNEITHQFSSFYGVMRYLFPHSILWPLVILFTSVYFNTEILAFVGYGLFLAFNYKNILENIRSGISILIDRNSLKF